MTTEFIERLRRFVRKRVPTAADAEDIVQEVLVQYVLHQDSLDEARQLAWLYMVARRKIIDAFRDRSAARIDSLQDHEPAALAGDASAIEELAHCVEPLLELLPPLDRELLKRVDLGAESQAKIADELGMPRSTIKARVQRARKRLLEEFRTCCSIELDARGLPARYSRNHEIDACSADCDVHRETRACPTDDHPPTP